MFRADAQGRREMCYSLKQIQELGDMIATPQNRHVERVQIAVLIALLAAVRFVDLRHFPILGVDEGLWNLQAKDAVLFGDVNMNGLMQVFLSPGHFALTWALFHVAPATGFSVRMLNGVLGLVTLVIVWRLLSNTTTSSRALLGVAVIGLSWTMIMINRFAYLESGVICLSVLAVYFSGLPSRRALVGLTLAVGLLLLYKSNAIYLFPCLLIPSAEEQLRRGLWRRLAAIVAGMGLAALGFYLVSFMDPEGFREAYAFELNKGNNEVALIRLGRFGIYPNLIAHTLYLIGRRSTDLVFLTVMGLAGLWFGREARKHRLAWKAALWLGAGYASLLCQGFQHLQYFTPLIVPAGLLAVLGLQLPSRSIRVRWMYGAGLVLAFVTICPGRLAYFWVKARSDNPPLAALTWLESQVPAGQASLTCPEIAVATTNKAYAFSRVFRPYPPRQPPRLQDFVRKAHIVAIVYDQWEIAPYFRDDAEFLDDLGKFEKQAEGHDWIGLIVRPVPD
jgi:hypothetical protein